MSEDEMRERVRAKLKIVGLSGIEDRLPSDLSGGQRKRVGLARAIVMEPKIVLYDEPTTGLDPITTDYVDHMIMDTSEALGVTSVVISHDIASAFKVADQVAFLDQGVIADRGTPAQLSASPHPAVKSYLSTWFG
jgi:phospholipid/cholesterol/gamma-HCH transport system ATP-binding protein